MMSLPYWLRAGLVVALWGTLHTPTWAQAVATLTMKMGTATVIQGASRVAAVEGMRLSAEDIIETGDSTALVRLEMDNQMVIDLGPSAKLVLQPKWPGGVVAGGYLLQGWVKATPSTKEMSTRPLLITPFVELLTGSGEVVVHSNPQQTEVFSPAAQAKLLWRAKQNQKLQVDKGHYVALKASGTLPAAGRPESSFIQTVPRPFMDTLPRRMDKFAGKKIALAAPSVPTYADLQPWLLSEPKLRARWPARWQSLLQDPAFKAAIVKQLPQHAEWKPWVAPPSSAHPSTPSNTYTQP